MRTARSMPTMSAVAEYWKEDNGQTFPDLMSRYIGWGEPFCFRCGWLAPQPDMDTYDKAWSAVGGWLERAHLVDCTLGGPSTPDNIVPLCPLCHNVMPRGYRVVDDAASWVRLGNQRPAMNCRWQIATDIAWGGENFRPYPGRRALEAWFARAEALAESLLAAA